MRVGPSRPPVDCERDHDAADDGDRSRTDHELLEAPGFIRLPRSILAGTATVVDSVGWRRPHPGAAMVAEFGAGVAPRPAPGRPSRQELDAIPRTRDVSWPRQSPGDRYQMHSSTFPQLTMVSTAHRQSGESHASSPARARVAHPARRRWSGLIAAAVLTLTVLVAPVTGFAAAQSSDLVDGVAASKRTLAASVLPDVTMRAGALVDGDGRVLWSRRRERAPARWRASPRS